MAERALTESKLEKDVTKIDFPRVIDEGEADTLLRYFVAQMDEEGENSQFAVSVTYTQNRHYGNRLQRATYENLDEVHIRKGDTKIAGTIKTTIPELRAVSFEFKAGYDKLDRPSFTGINFQVTPGYEPGELECDSVEIMQNMRKYVNSYFEKTCKI